MEDWRKFISTARDRYKTHPKKEPEEEEVDEPSQMVAYIMARGALSREEAEKMATSEIALEEADELLARLSSK